VNLLEDLVDVRRVGLDTLLGALLAALLGARRSLSGLNKSVNSKHNTTQVRALTLEGAFEAPVGALEACDEMGALEATADLGGWTRQ